MDSVDSPGPVSKGVGSSGGWKCQITVKIQIVRSTASAFASSAGPTTAIPAPLAADGDTTRQDASYIR
ncbi:MAG: hypothetical protein PHD46_06410, partial [Eubacteriales bacterium]|nr:hypothetical protein [Eubacteriales bacterium]